MRKRYGDCTRDGLKGITGKIRPQGQRDRRGVVPTPRKLSAIAVDRVDACPPSPCISPRDRSIWRRDASALGVGAD